MNDQDMGNDGGGGVWCKPVSYTCCLPILYTSETSQQRQTNLFHTPVVCRYCTPQKRLNNVRQTCFIHLLFADIVHLRNVSTTSDKPVSYTSCLLLLYTSETSRQRQTNLFHTPVVCCYCTPQKRLDNVRQTCFIHLLFADIVHLRNVSTTSDKPVSYTCCLPILYTSETSRQRQKNLFHTPVVCRYCTPQKRLDNVRQTCFIHLLFAVIVHLRNVSTTSDKPVSYTCCLLLLYTSETSRQRQTNLFHTPVVCRYCTPQKRLDYIRQTCFTHPLFAVIVHLKNVTQIY